MTRLPSLSALYAFYVRATSPTLNHAAQKLFITHSAVSKQIKNLEEQLQVSLFKRTAQGLHLTEEGERLAKQLEGAFKTIEQAVSEVSKSTTQKLTIVAPPTIATRWLAGQIKDFYQRFPSVGLSMITSATNKDVDVEIVFAQDAPSEYAKPLSIEKNILVCSPSIFRKDIRSLLKEYPILHILHEDKVLPLWREWLESQSFNITIASEVMFSTQDQVIHAAENGLGVAIVDALMVESLLAKGALIQVGGFATHGPFGYWFLPKSTRGIEIAEAFYEWMLECLAHHRNLDR